MRKRRGFISGRAASLKGRSIHRSSPLNAQLSLAKALKKAGHRWEARRVEGQAEEVRKSIVNSGRPGTTIDYRDFQEIR